MSFFIEFVKLIYIQCNMGMLPGVLVMVERKAKASRGSSWKEVLSSFFFFSTHYFIFSPMMCMLNVYYLTYCDLRKNFLLYLSLQVCHSAPWSFTASTKSQETLWLSPETLKSHKDIKFQNRASPKSERKKLRSQTLLSASLYWSHRTALFSVVRN